MDKTIRKFNNFAEIKAEEYREWQAMTAQKRLEAASELSLALYGWKDAGHVQQRLQRTLVQLQRPQR
ncbi:MAG TPA: hypothetical protein VHZ52_02900 [Acidobacteriaceae bacterium]|jgi:hypothetical protein|nr:hypothetical protein [Acidobacteriaceae bacterium]